MYNFKDKVVIITGGARGIGKSIKEEFEKEGAICCVIDILENDFFIGDLKKEEDLIKFHDLVISKYKKIDYIINNAAPLFKGINECSYLEFIDSLKVGVVAPFYLAKLFKDEFNEGGVIINISSSRDRMSHPQSESYTASKGGIYALTHSLANSLKPIRVNSISPGWIDNDNFELSKSDLNQHLVNRVGKPQDIANMVLFLCSDKSSFITGENICIDGGMTRQMIYHNDFNWKLEE